MKFDTSNARVSRKGRNLLFSFENLFSYSNRKEDYEAALRNAGINLTFVKQGSSYRAKEGSGIALYQSHGEWLLANHSGKYNIPSGNLWNVTKALYGEDDPKIIAQLVAEAKGLSVAFLEDRPQPIHIPKIDFQLEPTLSISGSVIFTDWDTPQGKRTLEHLRHKTGAHAELLDRYNVRAITRHTYKSCYSENYNENRAIAYTYTVGETIKRKRKKFNGLEDDFKCVYVRKFGNYIFGYDQLPNICNGIVICAGEDDALCLNANLNSLGVYAICLSSESATLEQELVSDLRQRCKNGLFVWYDYDLTGVKFSKKWRDKFGIPRIDHSKFSPLNDICDLFQEHGNSLLLYIYKQETAYQHTIKRGQTSIIGTRLHIKKYLTEIKNDLCALISQNERVMLCAPTGSGKTHFVRSILENPSMIGVDKIILVFPTRLILHQQALAMGTDIPILDGESGQGETLQFSVSRGAMATFDSAIKLLPHIHQGEKIALIVDESHLLVDAQGYRREALNKLQTLAVVCQKLVFLSGTPNIELSKIMDMKWVEVECLEKQHIHLFPILYGEKTKRFDLIYSILKEKQKHGGRFLVRLNDVAALEEWKGLIEANGMTAIIFTSKDEKYTECQEYRDLLDFGTIPNNVDFILSTSLLDCGVSIISEISGIVTIGATTREVLQFLARPRMTGGKNERLKLFAYHKEKIEFAKPFDMEKTLGLFIDTARSLANEANSILEYETEAETFRRYNEHQHIYFNTITNQYEPSIEYILFEAEQRNNKYQTSTQYIDEIASLIPSCTVHETKRINIEGTSRRTEPVNIERLNEAIETASLETIIDAVYHSTTNKRVKIAIKKSPLTICQRLPSEAAMRFIEEYGDVLKNLEGVVLKFFKLEGLGLTKDSIPKVYLSIQNDFKTMYQRILVYRERTMTKHNRETKIRLREYDRLEGLLDEYVGKETEFKKIFFAVRRILGKHIDTDTVLMRVKELFEVRIRRSNNQSLILISERVNLSEISPQMIFLSS